VGKLIAALLVLVGLIHILPVSGVLGAEHLSALYGVSIVDPDLVILMRHRAVLFGLLGVFMIYAAFKPAFQPLAFLASFVSVVSFIVIAWAVGGYNEAIRRVVIADVVAVIALCVAGLLYVVKRGQS